MPPLRVALIALVAAGCGGTAQVQPVAPTVAAATPSPVAPVASTFAPSPSPAASSPLGAVALRDLTFMDATSGVTLFIQADASARDAGEFSLRVPGRGAYLARAGSGMTASSSSVALRYEGRAVLHPFVSLTDQSTTGMVKVPTDVTIKIGAQLDPASRTGTATLEHGGVVITMNARVPDVADLPPVLDTFERAMLKGDGLLLYTVMITDVASTTTPQEFDRAIADGITRVGITTSIRRGTIGNPHFGELGLWAVAVPYDVDRRAPNGVTSALKYEAYFVRQTVGWRLLTTGER
jgi:hypothetical protein